jgi:soluble lytic murein transglycosylase-like protein
VASLRPAAAALALMIASPANAIGRPAASTPVADWRSYSLEASLRFGVPVEWIERVMRAESGGRNVQNGVPIRSRAGAMGLMQLMPATWRAMRDALRLGNDPDDPRDNILAGTYYLRLLYDRFGYPGLFAAYNAGPGRFADHIATGRRLPSETIAYLGKVAGSIVAFAAQQAAPREMLFAARYPPAPPPAGPSAPPTAPSLFVVRHDDF